MLDPDPFLNIYPDLDPVVKISLQFETKFYWNIFKNKKIIVVSLDLMCVYPTMVLLGAVRWLHI
jgi:hypothetical protein